MSDEDDYDFDDLAEFDDPPDPEIEQEVLFDPEEDDDLAEFDEPAPVVAPEPEPVSFGRGAGKRPVLVATAATKTSEAIRRPLMSGHCSAPQSLHPEESHSRCKGYSRANPDGIFQPCPDLCHFPAEMYECGGCGGTIIEAPHYPVDEDGDTRYVHVDMKRKRVTDCECPR